MIPKPSFLMLHEALKIYLVSILLLHLFRDVFICYIACIGHSYTGVKSASRSFRKVTMASGKGDGGAFECLLLLLVKSTAFEVSTIPASVS